MTLTTIPQKHYVGMVVRSKNRIPLGFITPWGDDAAARKRMSTVDQWRNKDIPAAVIDNVPMLGFRLAGDIRRGERGAQDKWRIEDPRGFELEITSENLSMLLMDSTLEKGEILDQCVWAREGGQNLLLTTASEEYTKATQMTQIASQTASFSEAKPGYTVILQNGLTGRYLGKMHTVRRRYQDSSMEADSMIETTGKMLHFILESAADKTRLHGISSPKLSQIVEKNGITIAEAEVEVNAALSDDEIQTVVSGYNTVWLAAANPIKDRSWRLYLGDLPGEINPLKPPYSPTILARTKDGVLGMWTSHHPGYRLKPIRENELANGIFGEVKKKASRSFWNRSPSPHEWTGEAISVDPNNVISYHQILAEITTQAGNTFSACI